MPDKDRYKTIGVIAETHDRIERLAKTSGLNKVQYLEALSYYAEKKELVFLKTVTYEEAPK